MHLYVYSSTIYNSQDLETAPCSSVDQWIKKLWYIYTVEYDMAIKKKEILPFVTAWMDLGIIILSEISQLEKGKYHMISLIYGI